METATRHSAASGARGTSARLAGAVLALLVASAMVACSTAGPAPEPGTPTSAPVDPDAHPSLVTLDPEATPPNVVRPPLPEPELTDGYEIGDAIFRPMTRAQGVVSMLQGLGIGIYARDGTPIRPGDERASTDLWLYEDEVYALIDMAAAEARSDFISFLDWHAALEELGLQMSAEKLAEAYDEAYFWEFNESLFVEVILSMGLEFYDPRQIQLTRLQAWLLLLDGFVVGPDDPTAARAQAATFRTTSAASSHDKEKWGGASANIRRPLSPTDLPLDLFAAAARLETLTRSVPFVITPSRQEVHEGHGAEGDPTDFELWFLPQDLPSLTPFGDDWFLVSQPDPDGLTVHWHESSFAVLEEHGRLHDHDGRDLLALEPSTTRRGRVVARYVPRQEEADGEGEYVKDQAQLTGSVSLHEVARRTWQVPDILLGYLSSLGERSVSATLDIEWHEIRGLRIDMTDEYDVGFELPTIRGAEMSLGESRRIGTDQFSGFLALQDDGTYRGIVRGNTSSELRVRGFAEECSTSLVASQDLLVIAEVAAEDRGHPGDLGHPIVLHFYPSGQPEIDQIGCDYELDVFPDDPERGIRWGLYAPFNDRRIVDPVIGFLTAMPPSGEWTYVYPEFAPGLGGGTWTVIVEVVEPGL